MLRYTSCCSVFSQSSQMLSASSSPNLEHNDEFAMNSLCIPDEMNRLLKFSKGVRLSLHGCHAL